VRDHGHDSAWIVCWGMRLREGLADVVADLPKLYQVDLELRMHLLAVQQVKPGKKRG